MKSVSKIKNDKTFAVIIANENYRTESQVIFANNDGVGQKRGTAWWKTTRKQDTKPLTANDLMQNINF